MTGNFLGIVENVTFAADVSKTKPKFGGACRSIKNGTPGVSKTKLLLLGGVV
jgi:hypothetical protein